MLASYKMFDLYYQPLKLKGRNQRFTFKRLSEKAEYRLHETQELAVDRVDTTEAEPYFIPRSATLLPGRQPATTVIVRRPGRPTGASIAPAGSVD